MPLPTDWDTVEVYGTYVDVNGNPVTGVITFTAQNRLRSDAYETAIVPSTIAVNLDEQGSFVVDLPTTDDPDIDPAGWAWLVQERFGEDGPSPYKRNYLMLAPAGTPIDLTNIAPAVPPEEAPVVPWTSVAGKTPNAEGNIVLSHGDLVGIVPPQALPTLAVTDVHTVTSLDEMLALEAQQGDMAIRTDENITYVLASGDPVMESSWVKLATPTDTVLSVAGRTGHVTLTQDDVGLDRVDNTTDAAKPVSTATQAALDGKADTTTTVTAGMGLSGGGDLTSDRTFDVEYGTTAGTAAAGDDARITGAAQTGSNLADMDAPTARANLDLGEAATRDVGATTGTVADGGDARITGAAQTSSNLNDLADPAAARTHLGLGEAATREIGTTAGTVAAGDDPRFTTGGDTPAPVEAETPYLPVSNGAHFNGNGGAGTEGLVQARCRQTRKTLRVIAGGSDTLRLEWANIYTTVLAKQGDASCENPGPNNVSVRMAVEAPAGNPRIVSGTANWRSGTAYMTGDQVNHNGASWVATANTTGQTPSDTAAGWRRVRRYLARWDGDDTSGTVVFAPGDYKTSLDIDLAEPLRTGDMIAVLGAFDTGSTTGRIPYAGANGAAKHGQFVDWVVDVGGMPAAGQALPDTGVTNQTNGNTTTADDANASRWTKLPYATAITGNVAPGEQCVALFGDSLMAGYYDYRDGEPAGPFIRALDGARWWRIAQGGNAAACYAPGNAPWQMSALRRCTSVITNMGVNDVQYGLTTATTKARMERLWRVLGAEGVPVYACAFSPVTSSTDGWATVGNQGQYTAGGTVATTQFPGGSTAYEQSVWGQVQLWLTQDGAAVTTADGRTVKAGEYRHPLVAVVDDRAFFTDSSSGWRWAAPNSTTDGAHPNISAATIQGAYLAPELDNLLNANRRADHNSVFDPSGATPPICPFDRSMATDESLYIPSGSVMTVIGTSDGRYLYGMRWYSGSHKSNARGYSVLAGLDPTKMRVIASGSAAPNADGTCDIALPSAPVWIPRGYLMAAQLGAPAANAMAGSFVINPSVHITGFGYAIAAHVSNENGQIAVGTTRTLLNASQSEAPHYRAARFRPYVEVY